MHPLGYNRVMNILVWLNSKKNIGYSSSYFRGVYRGLIWKRPLAKNKIISTGPCDTREELEKEIIKTAFKLLKNGKNL